MAVTDADMLDDFLACYRVFRRHRGRWVSFWKTVEVLLPVRGSK